MSAWFASGRVIDLILLIVCLEAIVHSRGRSIANGADRDACFVGVFASFAAAPIAQRATDWPRKRLIVSI